MERTMSVEDKIKRAEEIYARRREGEQRKTTTVSINNNSKKEVKLLNKMIIQIAISLTIYLIIYIIQNNNYIFSEEFIRLPFILSCLCSSTTFCPATSKQASESA